MDNAYGVKVDGMAEKYVISYSLDRCGICVFEEENNGQFSRYISGPFDNKEEAEGRVEIYKAIDNG